MLYSVLPWDRGKRQSHNLNTSPGLYALFLAPGSILSVPSGDEGLLYIGKASGRRGLRGRCHFNARTANHSPRKSFSWLQKDILDLEPKLVTKPNSNDTWTLSDASEKRLTDWMHSNILLAVQEHPNPEPIEKALILAHRPPLNLEHRIWGPSQEGISNGRAEMMRLASGR